MKIDSCHVVKEYTFQGHGTRVTTHLLQIFAQSGTTTVTVDAPNAKNFYKKLGFYHDYAMQVLTMKLTPSWVRKIGFNGGKVCVCAHRRPASERRYDAVCVGASRRCHIPHTFCCRRRLLWQARAQRRLKAAASPTP